MTNLSLEVKRILKAPITRVYRAWADPAELRQWHCPEGLTMSEAASDTRTGGSYRFRMVDPGGGTHLVAGTYTEVDPPNKLVFTWDWLEGGGGSPNTQVTVLFKSLGPDRTELTLIHERFESEESRDAHAWGWNGTIDNLEKLLGESA